MMQIFSRVCRQLLRGQLSLGNGPCRGLQQSSTGVSTLEGTLDRYNGVTVDLHKQLPATTSTQDFQDILKASLLHWRHDERCAIWLQVPIHYSRFIDVAAMAGFQFHNAEHDQCLLKLWLQDRADPTPRFATHQVGVCGVVMRDDTQELLVVKEKKSQFTFWKFPGGLTDLSEDIGDAAVRETFEETGIKSDFRSVIAVRQQHRHPFAFGRSDMYVVCRLTPKTYDIVPCDHEISECRWMPITEVREHVQISSITSRIIMLMQHGTQHGFDSIDIVPEQLQSVYKGLTFHLFHRPMNNVKL